MYEDQKQEPSGILLQVPEPTCTIKPEDCLPPGKTEGSVLRPFIGVGICYQKMTACLLNSASYFQAPVLTGMFYVPTLWQLFFFK